MKTESKNRPILFSAPMVRALLAGTKTQTRRVFKLDAPAGAERTIRLFPDERLQWSATDPHDMEQGQLLLGELPPCPYGQPGDRLWVKETWAAPHAHDGRKPSEIPAQTPVHFAATEDLGGLLKRTSLFMPRWASRITLEVTRVRVERLQDICEADALAEGLNKLPGGAYEVDLGDGVSGEALSARRCYQLLWEDINGEGSWDLNPWVWVVEFRRLA